MDVLHQRCAALDLGTDLKAGVRTPGPARKGRRQQVRTFATTTGAVLQLRDWLVAGQVSVVVRDAPGDYGHGAFSLREDAVTVRVVHARHAQALPGCTTGGAEAAGLCQGGGCGLRRAWCPQSRSATCMS